MRIQDTGYVMALAASLVGAVVGAWAQQMNVPLVDQSNPGSPLAVFGSVSLTERIEQQRLIYNFDSTIDAKNVSDKTILALLVEVRLRSAYGGGVTHINQADCFFARDVIAPGGLHAVARPSPGLNVDPIGPSPIRGSPSAEVRVRYVQFLDGSIFGDESAARELFRLRRMSWHELRRLLRTYEREGEQAFLAALGERVQPSEVDNFIEAYRRTQKVRGTAAVIEQIRSSLRFAEEHRRAIGEDPLEN